MSEQSSQKVMFLHTSALLGGAERVFLDFFANLADEKRKNAVIALPESGPLSSHIEENFPESQIFYYKMPAALTESSRKSPARSLIQVSLSIPKLIDCVRRLKTEASRLQVDTIYAQGLKAQILSLPVSQAAKTRLVWHTHDFFPPLAPVKAFLSIWRAPDLSISISKAVETAVLRAIPSKWSTRHVVVHNAVDLNNFSYVFRTSRGEAIRIVMIGMLTPWKGQHLLLEAVSLLKKKGLATHVDFIGEQIYKTHGETGYRELLIKKCDELGISNQVTFHGLQKEIQPYFANADIAVHATTSPEPFGKVIIEAMAAGTPVIASRGGGVLEIIEDGTNGLLFELNDSNDLAGKIEQLSSDSQLREKIATSAREAVERNFNLQRFVEDLTEQVYSESHS